MKKYLYALVGIIFAAIMALIVIFFNEKYETINEVNAAKSLLKYVNTLNDGNYLFEDGYIKDENGKLLNKNYYFEGMGKINKDKYGNVKFYINNKKHCINKTSLGEVEAINSTCYDYGFLDANISRNNNIVSFHVKGNNIQYKISSSDNFIGKWVSQNYDENIIVKDYIAGDNFIWFKDNKGNISNVIKFNIECLKTNSNSYDSNLLYCSGSTVKIDNIEWIVLSDNSKETNLMTKNSLNKSLSHCTKKDIGFCYYNDENNNKFKWSNSQINNYLNNEFINSLSENIISKLVNKSICDEYNAYGCEGDGCGGFTKEYIDSNNFTCNKYTKSKVRIISYDEYNNYVNNVSNYAKILGNYWTINSFSEDKGTTTQSNNEIYILEDLTHEKNVKAVITIQK